MVTENGVTGLAEGKAAAGDVWKILSQLGGCDGTAGHPGGNSPCPVGEHMGRGLGGLVGRRRSFIPQTFMASTLPGLVCPWGMNGPEPLPSEVHSPGWEMGSYLS